MKFPFIFTLAFTLAATAPALRAQEVPVPDLAPASAFQALKKPQSDKWVFSILPVGLQKNPLVDYTIFTEMTNAGRKLPPPSLAAPVYYIPIAVGQVDIGDAYGNTKNIPYQKIQRLLDTALASNGYRANDATHPPAQVLLFAWGMHNKISFPGDDVGEKDIRQTLHNIVSRAKVVGGRKFAVEVAKALDGRDFSRERIVDDVLNGLTDTIARAFVREVDQALAAHNFHDFSPDADLAASLCYAVMHDCYYLLVASLDAEILSHYKQRKTLWITHITTVSRGLNFEMTLPVMVSNASYYFGRETEVPEILLKHAYMRASVDIGEAQVVDYITGTTK